jgi:hypothetical protein
LVGSTVGNQQEQLRVKTEALMMHRKLLDLARAQTREIELMREELVRLRAKTFPSFAQVRGAGMVGRDCIQVVDGDFDGNL